MAKFVLIDHSLQAVGGHHYQYARQMLLSAAEAGYDVHLVTNRKFTQLESLPSDWRVFPVFGHTTYEGPNSYFRGYRSESAERLRRWPLIGPALRGWDRLPRRSETRKRKQLVAQFARHCFEVQEAVAPGPADQVFFPTVSELDLLGLASFLRACPESRHSDWHVQFHFDVFGRNSDTPQDAAAMQRAFRDALVGLEHHRIYFYTTTERLADQYNQLGVGTFTPLPYPAVMPPLEEALPARAAGEPFHVTCPGHLRAEKGRRELGTIVEQALADFEQNPGREPIQFRLQVQARKFQRHLTRDAWRKCQQADVIDFVPFPLDDDAYHKLVRGSDIGLLAYQRDRYHARASAILVEMLCAGVPVLVPAGCWLSEQIAEPTYRHLDRMVATYGTERVEFSVEAAGGTDASWQSPELTPLTDASNVLLTLRQPPGGAAHFTRVTLECTCGTAIVRQEQIVSRRMSGSLVRASFRIPPGSASLRLRCESAFGLPAIDWETIHLDWLDGRERAGGYCPNSAVGYAFAQLEDASRGLAEMTCHLDHYRDSAGDFTRHWSFQHHPMRTIETLLETGDVAARVA